MKEKQEIGIGYTEVLDKQKQQWIITYKNVLSVVITGMNEVSVALKCKAIITIHNDYKEQFLHGYRKWLDQ